MKLAHFCVVGIFLSALQATPVWSAPALNKKGEDDTLSLTTRTGHMGSGYESTPGWVESLLQSMCVLFYFCASVNLQQ